MPVKTIEWKNGAAHMIDQTLLPQQYKIIRCETVEKIWDAIKTLKIRGAPAIGIAAAFGLLIASEKSSAKNYSAYKREMQKSAKYLGSSRPTAINLFWALDRIMKVVDENENIKIAKKNVKKEALKIFEEDKKICRRIGENGEKLIPHGATIITHCNAGGLATADYGTALACLYFAHEKGKKLKVFSDETRPLLQGSRLTYWELTHAGIDTTIICDNMAAHVMNTQKVDLVIVGADRIAANGDTANKIGTYSLALAARAHRIPFYVAAPLSTFDLSLKSGKEIPIEERNPKEVVKFKAKVYNPAFDVTPANLITGIVTEKGVIKNPTFKKISNLFSYGA